MALQVYQRYEIVFLSQHPLGPKLSHTAVAKAIHCDVKTVKRWLKRWQQSKDLTDAPRSGRPRATTAKQDQQVIALAEQQTFITSQGIANKLNKKGVEISQRTVRRRLNEAGAKYNQPLSKPLLTDNHREKRLKWAQDQRSTDWNQVIFSDETTIRMNSVKGLVWNLPGKKKVVRTVKHPVKVNVWGCFSIHGFGRVVCFKENLNADLMCHIYKYGLLPTARKQFGPDSTLWKLQEDNDPKHTSKLATSWRMNNNVDKIDWPSMSPDIAPIENVWQLLKMNLRKKKLTNYESLVSAIKQEWKSLSSELAVKLVHSMNHRLSEVIENAGDFILH